MARREGKKKRRAGKLRNQGGTRTECNNDQSAVPTTTPSGEKGDELMLVNDESNGSAFDTIEKKIEEAEKMNEASFLNSCFRRLRWDQD